MLSKCKSGPLVGSAGAIASTAPAAARGVVGSTRAARVHRIPPDVRDVAQRPSEWGGTARDMQVIWPWGQEEFGKSEIDCF